jgi:serine/threonine protein kinase
MINQYQLLEIIGLGKFSKVALAVDDFDQKVAIKIINKERLMKKRISPRSTMYDRVKHELKIYSQIESHPSIVKLIEFIDEPKDTIGEEKNYFVMEYLPNGSLFELLSKRSEPFNEEEAKVYFYDIIKGLEYCKFVLNSKAITLVFIIEILNLRTCF